MRTTLQNMFGNYSISDTVGCEYEFAEIGEYININMERDLLDIDISHENELISRLREFMKVKED